MTDDEARFVDAMSEHLYSRGLARMPARMWAWLLICEPAEQTAAQLCEELHASRGAISGAAHALAAARLIRRGSRRGDRREYFSVPPGVVSRLLGGMGALVVRGREIADEGLALMTGRSPASRARLQEVRDAYAYYEREWPTLLERFLAERATQVPGVQEGTS